MFINSSVKSLVDSCICTNCDTNKRWWFYWWTSKFSFEEYLVELETNHIYEIYGPQGAGKTQFSLAMTARISEEGQVFYIDTKNDFSSLSRLKSDDEHKKIRCNQAVK